MINVSIIGPTIDAVLKNRLHEECKKLQEMGYKIVHITHLVAYDAQLKSIITYRDKTWLERLLNL